MARRQKGRRGGASALFLPGVGYLTRREQAEVWKRLRNATTTADSLPEGAAALLQDSIVRVVQEQRRARQFFGCR